MLTQYETNLITDVLNTAHLTQMPKADTGKVVWLEAIAKLRLANNNIAYGILRRNPDLTHRVLYVNGSISMIVNVEELYPYITLDKERVKKFTAAQKEKARVEYLRALKLPYLEGIDLEAMTIDELNKEVVKAAVYEQLKDLNTRKA